MTKENLTVQSPQDVQLKKYSFSLIASGNAMILFSIWTVISTIIWIYYQVNPDPKEAVSIWSITAFILAINSIDLILKLIAGFLARSQGRGRYHHSIIIVLGIIVAMMSVYNMISYIPLIPYYYEHSGLLQVIISIAVEITVLYAAIDLVVSSAKVKTLLKKTGAQAA